MLMLFSCILTQTMLFDFNHQSNITEWYKTNDTVMGGVSNSSLKLNDEGNGVFSGYVSIENNGGFAMIRLPKKHTIAANEKYIKLRVKGDGKQYQFRLKSKENQRYWYVQKFQTKTNWQEILLPLQDFYPSFRGYRLDMNNFEGSVIQEVAILIGNKKNEEFALEIDYIQTH